MKTIFTTLALVCLSTLSFGQTEILLGAGSSVNGSADGNMYYKGNQMMPNYMSTVGLLYNLNGGWQIGLEAYVSGMSSMANNPYAGMYDGASSSNKFVFADIATALCVVGNKKFSFGSNDFYGGIAAGLGVARSFNSQSPQGGVAYKAPDGGRGFVYGAQLGYIYNFTQTFGLGIELGAREYHFVYDAHATHVEPSAYLNYYILAYTGAITLHFTIPGYNNTGYNHSQWYKRRAKSRDW